MKEVYLVVDDYTPDAGSTIYGAYSTYSLAQEAIDKYSTDDNEYGCNMNERDCMDITILRIQEV